MSMESSTVSVKEEIHELIDAIQDEKVLEAVRTLIKPYTSALISEEYWQQLEEEDMNYKSGKGKNYSWDEVKKLLNKNIQ